MDLISILLGSRNRPAMFKAMVDSFLEKMDNPLLAEFVVYLDDDDKYLDDYLSVDYAQVNFLVKPRIAVMSEMTNVCGAYAKGNILMMGADDIECQTYGWDKRVRDAFSLFSDRIALVYGSDGHFGNTFATHPFISKQSVNVLGEVCDGRFAHAYADRALWDIYSTIGRTYYIPILTYHRHHDYKERSVDQVDLDQKANFNKSRPDLVYLKSWAINLEKAGQLREYINGCTRQGGRASTKSQESTSL